MRVFNILVLLAIVLLLFLLIVGTYKHSRLNKDCIVVGHSRFLLWGRSGSHSKASLLSNPEFKLITNDFEYGAIFPKTYFHKIDYRIWIS